LQALETLEQAKDFAQLPALFATTPGDTKELDYLNDALAVSLDQLIRDASPDARRLLWMIAIANEPVALGLLKSVWSGEDYKQQQLRQIKQLLDMLPDLPAERQAQLKALPLEVRARIDALPPERPAPPDIEPLLRHLVSVGLVTEKRQEPDDANPDLTCHELVRERIRAWMEQQPGDRSERTESAIRLAYAERLEALSYGLLSRNMTVALEAGRRALVYCVQAEDWDRLDGFAGSIVNNAREPRLLAGLIPYLQIAAESAPEGPQRWRCLCIFADALRESGRPDASLTFYEHTASLARAAAEGDGVGSQEAWSSLAVITGNWAISLAMTANMGAARQRQIESAEASKKSGRPAIHAITAELEALRIDIVQGQVAVALPQVEAKLAQVASWWQRHLSGQPVPEAPDAAFLAGAFMGALDVAREGYFAQEDWDSALLMIDASLKVKLAMQHPAERIAITRVNRANVLKNLGRFIEAKKELEDCLPLLQNNPEIKARVFSNFADLFAKQDDLVQAINQARHALALREQLPNPSDRAISHGNLAAYLSSTPSALAEADRHHLAALIYRLVAGLEQQLQISWGNYAIAFHSAHAAGAELAVPRVAELLADPAFHPLAQWLRQRRVDMASLQTAVDQFLEQARQAALKQQ
jgi:tetratricopeptide (TPR) repeat protein